MNDYKEIDAAGVYLAIWKKKIHILAVSGVFFTISLLYSFSLPDTYESNVLLVPVDEANKNVSMLSRFGGLANLAGFDMSNTQVDKVTLGLELLKSRAFLIGFIERHGIKVPLLAGKEWDDQESVLVIDKDIYDVTSDTWMGRNGASAMPSDLQVYSRFLDCLTVKRHDDTGLVSISVTFLSPVLVQKWIDLLVSDLNDYLRKNDIIEAEKSIEYLKSRVSETRISDMKLVLYQLMEQQTQKKMLAEVREEYVFRTVDPAMKPDKKSGPNRLFIVAMSTMLGLGLAVFLTLFLSMAKK